MHASRALFGDSTSLHAFKRVNVFVAARTPYCPISMRTMTRVSRVVVCLLRPPTARLAALSASGTREIWWVTAKPEDPLNSLALLRAAHLAVVACARRIHISAC